MARRGKEASASIEEPYQRIMQWCIRANDYKNILEIGVHKGQTSLVLAAALPRKSTYDLVDISFDLFKPHLDINKLTTVTKHCMTSDDFFKANDKKFDFILVDGAHDYDSALRDLDNAKQCLTECGTIAIHDTTVYKPGVFEVGVAVSVFKQKYGGTWIDLKDGSGVSFVRY